MKVMLLTYLKGEPPKGGVVEGVVVVVDEVGGVGEVGVDDVDEDFEDFDTCNTAIVGALAGTSVLAGRLDWTDKILPLQVCFVKSC